MRLVDKRSDSGFATVWALAWIGVCLTLGWIGLLSAGVAAAQHHLDGSADLVSLAGATELGTGGDGCSVAAQIATDNGVRVAACAVQGNDLVGSVQDTVVLPFGLDGTLTSAARAGPG